MAPTPRLALITVAATLAYLGLAILGGGGFAAFFSHSALIALTILLFALSGVAIFSDGNLSRGVREDRANRWVIIAFGLIGLLAAYLPAYADRKGFWTLDGDAIRWLGVVLFAAGGALRIWPALCARSTAPARRGLSPGSIEAVMPNDPPARRELGADSRLSRKHFGARGPQDAPWSAFWGGRAVSLANSATLAESPIDILLWDFPLKSHFADAASLGSIGPLRLPISSFV